MLKSGVCGCQGYDLTQGGDYKTIYDSISFLDDYIGEKDDGIKRQVVELLCSSTVSDGDHLQVRDLTTAQDLGHTSGLTWGAKYSMDVGEHGPRLFRLTL